MELGINNLTLMNELSAWLIEHGYESFEKQGIDLFMKELNEKLLRQIYDTLNEIDEAIGYEKFLK